MRFSLSGNWTPTYRDLAAKEEGTGTSTTFRFIVLEVGDNDIYDMTGGEDTFKGCRLTSFSLGSADVPFYGVVGGVEGVLSDYPDIYHAITESYQVGNSKIVPSLHANGNDSYTRSVSIQNDMGTFYNLAFAFTPSTAGHSHLILPTFLHYTGTYGEKYFLYSMSVGTLNFVYPMDALIPIPKWSGYITTRSSSMGSPTGANIYTFNKIFEQTTPTTYTVTYHLVHATGDSENPTSVSVEVAEGQDVFMRFYPEDGYDLKYGSVPIGTGYGPDDSVIYVWNAERGEMMIRGFTSDITVEVIGVVKAYPIDPSDPTDPSTIDPDSPNYDFSSTIIPIPTRPTWDYAQAGFCNVYLPTAQELNSLALYLWSGSFSADNFKKMFNNPMEAILGCHLVPLSLNDIDHDDGTLAYGNNDTGIEMKIALSNWISYDCGRVKLPVYYGAYLSYSPYTKIQIYLPFIGMHRLDADSIIGKYVHVVYRIDIVTGSCVALIAVGDDTENETIMYQFAGSCSTEIPVTQGDYKNALQILQGVVSSSVGMVSNVITSGFRGGYGGMAGAIGGMASGAISSLGGAASALIDAVKPDVSISGNLSSSTGYLGVRIPYLVISTPRICLPDEQGRFIGLPIYATSYLQQLTGFTQVESIHLEGFYYTEDELSELEELLKSGVIL